jgi:protein TonB
LAEDEPATSSAIPLPDPAPDSDPLPDPLPESDGQVALPEPDAADPDPLADADCVAEPPADALPDPDELADPEALPEPPQLPKLRTSAPSSSPQATPMVASASDSAVAVMMR